MARHNLTGSLLGGIQVKSRTLGWISSVYIKKKTAYLALSRSVVIGSSLRRTDKLYSYVVEDEEGRQIVLTYLDGEPKTKKGTTERLSYNSFVHVE